MRDWRLTKLLGPRPVWENLPAMYLDRLLAIDNAVQRGEANVRKKAQRGN